MFICFLDFEYHSVFVWTGEISKTLLGGRGYFDTDEKDAFSKIPDTCVHGLDLVTLGTRA